MMNGRQSDNESLDDFSIDHFQLNNLINNQVSFLFFDVSSTVSPERSKNAQISHLLQSAKSCSRSLVLRNLNSHDPTTPIVVICETGQQSSALVKDLQKQGFINAFFIQGGMKQLLQEHLHS